MSQLHINKSHYNIKWPALSISWQWWSLQLTTQIITLNVYWLQSSEQKKCLPLERIIVQPNHKQKISLQESVTYPFQFTPTPDTHSLVSLCVIIQCLFHLTHQDAHTLAISILIIMSTTKMVLLTFTAVI